MLRCGIACRPHTLHVTMTMLRPQDCKLGSLDNTFEGFTFTDHASHLLPGGPAGSSDVASSVVEEGMVFEAADI